MALVRPDEPANRQLSREGLHLASSAYTAILRRSENMQQVKTYTSGIFKGEARDQLVKDIKRMAREGWHIHTITDEGVGKGQAHTGRLTAVYEK
jgi:hypothetical protein